MRLVFFMLLLLNAGMAAYFLAPRSDATATLPLAPPLRAEAIRLPAEFELSDKPPVKKVAPPKPVCVEWSGISDEVFPHAREVLEKLGLKDQMVLPPTADYWVHMPPLKNLKEAEKKREELRDLGVEEGAIVMEAGKWRYAIDLAAFAGREEAEVYLKQLRLKGVRSARMVERRGVTNTITLLAMDVAARERLQQLKGEFEKSELKNVDCRVR